MRRRVEGKKYKKRKMNSQECERKEKNASKKSGYTRTEVKRIEETITVMESGLVSIILSPF